MHSGTRNCRYASHLTGGLVTRILNKILVEIKLCLR
jgi:hypothetical protein